MSQLNTVPSDVTAAVAADGVSALRVLHGGKPVYAVGRQNHPIPIHSVRKSAVSALIGTLVDDRVLSLETTLADLGIDDQSPLTAVESTATVEDLLTSSSGIYLPIDGSGFDVFTGRPTPWPLRGSVAPGSRFHYNNWDFNVLGEIYQRVSGRSLIVAFDQLIAQPLGFLDWQVLAHSRLRYAHDPLGATPRYPNHALQLSARDLATFGQLYLNGGELGGRRVVSTDWVRLSTQPVRSTHRPEPFSHYGYLWWVGTGGPAGLPSGSFAAVGLGGPALCVIPAQDLVIAAVCGGDGAERGRMWLPINVINAVMPSLGGCS